MRHLTSDDIQSLPSRFRAQFINSITGVKSANLIGSVSARGNTNLAIFSSVVHLGSNPALLGFLLRPTTVERHTFNNIKETSAFTINQVQTHFIDKAHQTSAKYNHNISEFEAVGLEEEFLSDCKAPFVKSAPLKIACRYKNEYVIEENGCRLIIGEVTDVFYQKQIQSKDGFLDLTQTDTAGILGSDAYVKIDLLHRYEYAQPDQVLKTK
ncbi:flavin reductase family protein [Mesohalobacter halotolerans]|uniref:Flavin oxidoreductase n=1 Tax=Mesohalobacter halotolerans TaxID=1883405 RepID=A0A4U5TQW4_9FLAO|nr:flavin reductase [Mesohalobacter halotolerans]MBS3739111.1 flavin reductase [Psychroflexus sp.]TKS56453.1 flavin oxidoreductase [Mesohalobacter halotolerans]